MHNDLSDHFEDPDGDDLTYTATSSNPGLVRAVVDGSRLTYHAVVEGGTGTATVMVTASDGKDDGTASFSFNVTVANRAAPIPVFSKPNLFLQEQPFDHAVSDLLKGGRDSYTVTLDSQPLNPVTVVIRNVNSDLLQVTPIALEFNSSNWNRPQTVEVETIGRLVSLDGRLQTFTLSHTALITTAEGNRLDTVADLPVEVVPADASFLEDLARDLVDIALGNLEEDVKQEVQDKFLKKAGENVKRVALKKVVQYATKALSIGRGIQGVNTIIDRLRTAVDMYLRSEGKPYGEEQLNRLAQTFFIHHGALQSGAFSLDQAFSGQDFSFPLSLAQGGSEEENGASTRRFNALFTGGLDFSRFSDGSAAVDFDGTTTSYRLGLDVLPNPEALLVTGLQLAFTRTNVDFHDTEIDTQGTYGANLFTVSPNLIWDATDNLTLQASLGYGRGETETTIDAIADDRFDFVEGSSTTSSGNFFSVAVGATVRIWESDASALAISVDGSTASFLDSSVQQGRLAGQFSRDFTLEAGRLKSSADLALLLSNSDPGATELSGSLNWLPDQGRLSGTTTARVLLFGGDRSEWGIGGGLTLLPSQEGEGLSLSLQPSFGQASASLAGLGLDAWDRYNDLTELALDTEPLTARFHAEVAYGFRHGNGLLTPYTQLDMTDASTVYGTGLRYALDNSLDLDLSASRRSRSSGNNENRLFLQLRSDL